MSVSSFFLNTFVQRNSVFVGTIFASAFALHIGFDTAANNWWDRNNYGKQWKDIRSKYVQAGDSEDDE